MTHRKTGPNDRRCIVRFVIFRGFNFNFSVKATLTTASHIITVRNERLIVFCTLTVSGRVTATTSLVIALVIRVVSALVIRAPPFPHLLLPIAVLVQVFIRMMIWAPFSCAVLHITWLIRLSHQIPAIFIFMPRLFAIMTCKGHSRLTHVV